MRVYFWTPRPIEDRRRWTEARRCFRDRGIVVVSNHDKHIRQTIEQAYGAPDAAKGHQHFLSLFHGIVVDLSTNHEDVGYLIAHATIAHLPAFVLHARTTSSKHILDYLRPDVRSKYLTEYHEETDDLDHLIAGFIRRMDRQIIRPEKPTIKYTLRITRELSEYLDWRQQDPKSTKADMLRDILYQIMNDDHAYRQHRRLNKDLSKGN